MKTEKLLTYIEIYKMLLKGVSYTEISLTTGYSVSYIKNRLKYINFFNDLKSDKNEIIKQLKDIYNQKIDEYVASKFNLTLKELDDIYEIKNLYTDDIIKEIMLDVKYNKTLLNKIKNNN